MRKLLIVCILFFIDHSLHAQGREVKLPVYGYPELQQSIESASFKSHHVLSKAAGASIYPFMDWFTSSQLNDSLWQTSNVTVTPGNVVFNAQDANGATYSGVSGVADVLKSDPFIFFPSHPEAFVYLTYSTGNSWSASDSLVLRLKSSGGTMISIWHSDPSAVSQQTAIIPINNLTDYVASDFYFELIAYTTYSAANTETFKLHQLAVSEKWSLPKYENFYTYDTLHKQPSHLNWLQAQSSLAGNIETGKGNSNAVAFDAFDENNQVYNNANGQYGMADRMLSAPINLLSFTSTDAVYLRYFVKAMPNAKPTDSLILEMLNKTGQWIKTWSMTGAQQGGFVAFMQNVNIGKFPGANFQFRLTLHCHYTAADTLKFLIAGVHIGKKTTMPFLDDFSTSGPLPDQQKWTNSNTYINTRFAIKPPSINVATFDGLDRYGNPYKNVVRYADTLTSVPVNLSSIASTDTNLYLSFWLQTKGRGDLPNSSDSLVLEFRTSATQAEAYKVVWRAARSEFATDTFRQIVIKVDSIYYHDDFQFRFKNKCNKLGNLEHWHLDMMRLDNTGKNDLTWYNDVTLSEAPGSLLTPFASMPYDHYAVNPSAFTRSTQQITARNLKDVAKPIRYAREIFDPSGTRIDSIGNPIGSVVSNIDIPLGAVNVPLNFTPVGDSTVFQTRYTATSLAGGDNNIFTNDSLTVPTVFSNFYAYDDGSAENGYAIMNTTGSVALKYTLAKADKLYGVSMFFNQSITDVSTRNFTLRVWKAINTNGNGTGEDKLAEFPLLTPVYTNKINGFYYYQFPNPIDLTAGDFYIGWTQDQLFALNIGCDENFDIAGNHVNPNGYVFLDDFGKWAQTEVSGALMLRPIIGKWINPPVGIQPLNADKSKFSFYPNPATSFIHLTPSDEIYSSIALFDISGRNLITYNQVSGQIELPQLSEGIYLLKATSANGTVAVKKLQIR